MRRMVFFMGMLVRTSPPAAWIVATQEALLPLGAAVDRLLALATPAWVGSSYSAAADLSPLISARRSQVWLPAAPPLLPFSRVRAALAPTSALWGEQGCSAVQCGAVQGHSSDECSSADECAQFKVPLVLLLRH